MILYFYKRFDLYWPQAKRGGKMGEKFYIYDELTNEYLIWYEMNDGFGYREGYTWTDWLDFEEMMKHTDGWYFYTSENDELLEKYDNFVHYFEDKEEIVIKKTGIEAI